MPFKFIFYIHWKLNLALLLLLFLRLILTVFTTSCVRYEVLFLKCFCHFFCKERDWQKVLGLMDCCTETESESGKYLLQVVIRSNILKWNGEGMVGFIKYWWCYKGFWIGMLVSRWWLERLLSVPLLCLKSMMVEVQCFT